MKDVQNPWSMYGPVLVSITVLYVLAFALKLNVLEIIICITAVVVVLFCGIFLWYIAYPRWFAKKINPYMVIYQQNHDSYAYFDGIDHWEKYAFSRVCKNALMINKFSVLYEENKLEECLKLLSEYDKKMKSIEEKRYILRTKILCLEKMNDAFRKEKAERELLSFNDKYGAKTENVEKTAPATAYQSKKAMFCWLIASLVFLILLIVGACLDVYSGFLVFFLFFGVMNLLVSLAWFIRWLILRAKEHRN